MVNIPNNEDVTPLHIGIWNPTHFINLCLFRILSKIACSKGFLEVVQMLIENGANVNMKDYGLFTPLHEAAIPVR